MKHQKMADQTEHVTAEDISPPGIVPPRTVWWDGGAWVDVTGATA